MCICEGGVGQCMYDHIRCGAQGVQTRAGGTGGCEMPNLGAGS